MGGDGTRRPTEIGEAMLDHIIIRVKDLEKMGAYYERVLGTLGYTKGVEYPGGLQLVSPDGRDSTWISPWEGDVTPAHVAWLAADAEQVQAFYDAAMDGGTDNGAPGPRDYHPGYYACFVHDPEGNNIEAVVHDYEG